PPCRPPRRTSSPPLATALVSQVNGQVAQVLVPAALDHDIRAQARRARPVRRPQVILLPGDQSLRQEAAILAGLDLDPAGTLQARPIHVQDQPRHRQAVLVHDAAACRTQRLQLDRQWTRLVSADLLMKTKGQFLLDEE